MSIINGNTNNWSFAYVLLLGLVIIIITSFFIPSCESDSSYSFHIDTTYSKKPYVPVVIKKEDVVIPNKVIIYPKDTARRKEKEKEDIIESVIIKRKVISITYISPLGDIQTKVYNLPDNYKEVVITNTTIAIKKRSRVGRFLHNNWKKIVIGVGVVAGAILFFR